MSHAARITLLTPFFKGAKNRLTPPGVFPTKPIGLLIFCLAVCLALYFVTLKVLTFFHGQSEIGIILSLKIFALAWIIFFAMLVFSNTVAGMSNLYLAKDTEIILAAPVPLSDIFFMRSFNTMLQTSWMLLIFSLPIFFAYGQVFQAGPLYLPFILFSVFAVTLSAGCLAMLLTIILVTVFPARRTKDIIFYLSLCFGIFLYFLIRLLQPENLVNPDQFGQFVEYLSSISTPAGPYIPAAWAAKCLSLYIMDREIDWLLIGLLATTGPVFFILGQWAIGQWFLSGHTKSQESFGGYRKFGIYRKFRKNPWRQLISKENKTFFRDSSEWSQLFMVAALIVVYLYNFKLLPLDRAYIKQEYLANIISFCNIGLAGFLIISLATRFVYPSIGSEGRGFSLLRAAPLSMQRFLATKLILYSIPFTLLGLILILVSNHLLGITGPMWWFSLFAILPLSWGVLALSLIFGVWHGDFRAPSRAAAVGSFGAISFLFTAMAYELVIIILGTWPVYSVTRKWMAGFELGLNDLLFPSLWFVLHLALSFFLIGFLLTKGAEKLDRTTP